ncbi:MAG: hypothetical protein U5L96_19905 [Owenweeksia sp.]|nr:hypothetical protein [Owenweeksia sp.]
MMLIGVVSIAVSFLTRPDHHHEDGAHGEHQETALNAGEHSDEQNHGAESSEHGQTNGEHSHKAAPDYLDGVDVYQEEENHDYHKTAPRAMPESNHFYETQCLWKRMLKTKHHWEANLPGLTYWSIIFSFWL